MTRCFIVRIAREYKDIIWNSLIFIDSFLNKKVKIKILHCAGTIKKLEIMAKRYLTCWVHKILKNSEVINSVRENLINKYDKAKIDIEKLEE